MGNKLLAYAAHFASFLLESGIDVDMIIAFGSAASGEFDKESDVDLFIEADTAKEKSIMAVKKVFESTFAERWRLKGIENPLSILVGSLKSAKWEDLRRSIQSNGIVLYSHYVEMPENAKPYTIFVIKAAKLARARKMSMWRKLYGYSQKIGVRVYRSRGLLDELGGEKLEKGVTAVTADKSKILRDFLNKHRAEYKIYEFWGEEK